MAPGDLFLFCGPEASLEYGVVSRVRADGRVQFILDSCMAFMVVGGSVSGAVLSLPRDLCRPLKIQSVTFVKEG